MFRGLCIGTLIDVWIDAWMHRPLLCLSIVTLRRSSEIGINLALDFFLCRMFESWRVLAILSVVLDALN